MPINAILNMYYIFNTMSISKVSIGNGKEIKNNNFKYNMCLTSNIITWIHFGSLVPIKGISILIWGSYFQLFLKNTTWKILYCCINLFMTTTVNKRYPRALTFNITVNSFYFHHLKKYYFFTHYIYSCITRV